jgi:hypothetical protein
VGDLGETTTYQHFEGQLAQGLTFVVPAGAPVLVSFSVNLGTFGTSFDDPFVFEIFAWDGTTTSGGPLLTMPIPGLPSLGPQFEGALSLRAHCRHSKAPQAALTHSRRARFAPFY